jgi:hypothetical protein
MTCRTWVLVSLAALLAAPSAHAQGGAFTYQGRLASAAVPAVAPTILSWLEGALTIL